MPGNDFLLVALTGKVLLWCQVGLFFPFILSKFHEADE
jgi:hypothetical protein